MIYFSSILNTNPKYKNAAERIFAALELSDTGYTLLDNTNDIWLRDFMPAITKSGNYISFRYEPHYLDDYPHLKTNFKEAISSRFADKNILYTDINLDGGNIVFSPAKDIAVISDRIFAENRDCAPAVLVQKLEELLEARVIIIPSLRSDMTGHADGMIRFVDENTVIGNQSDSRFGLEARIKKTLRKHGIDVYDFPYFYSKKGSAAGCYLNFLETDSHLFLPVFGADTDDDAISSAKKLFDKKIVPVNINAIAKEGGLLNCISWED